MTVVPPKRPDITIERARELLAANGIASVDKTYLLGQRGFVLSMGDAGKNDRGIYDDAVAIVSPTAFIACNANTDPSAFGKGKASLVAGVWTFEIGTHNRSKPVAKQYEALVQAGKFIVVRDDTSDYKAGEKVVPYGLCLGDSKWTNYPAVPSFGLNIHRGGAHETLSEGCQTIYKPQWESFIATVKSEMKRYGQRQIQYVLVEGA